MAQPSPGDAASAQPDAQWLRRVQSFAEQIGAQFLIPIPYYQFASCSFDTTPSDVVEAYSQRTHVYYAFTSLQAGGSWPPSRLLCARALTALHSNPVV
jgi:hypothetical protein